MSQYDNGQWTKIDNWDCPIRWVPGHILKPKTAVDEWYWFVDGKEVREFTQSNNWGENKMIKPVVYLAGPIFQQSDAQATDWRNNLIEELGSDFAFNNPMDRDYRGKEDDSVDDIVEGDKLDIMKSDVIVANVRTPSAGTSMEILYAFDRKMNVIALCGEKISPWVKYHATTCVHTEADVIAELRKVKVPECEFYF
jgi:nucleoside 2-deoxyribosyltransferase